MSFNYSATNLNSTINLYLVYKTINYKKNYRKIFYVNKLKIVLTIITNMFVIHCFKVVKLSAVIPKILKPE